MKDGSLNNIPVDTIMQMIQKSLLFSALDRGGRLMLLERGKVQLFEPEEAIVLEGEPGNSFYLIVEGKVDVYSIADGSRIDLATLDAGQFFGEMSVLQNTPRSATCAANGQATLICFGAQIIGAILQSFPEAKQHILRTMVEREEDNYAKSLDHLLGFDLGDDDSDQNPGDDFDLF
jgi:CRP-like cAMP-binding protein